jgi:hypothetical protein
MWLCAFRKATPRAQQGHQWIELAELIFIDTTIFKSQNHLSPVSPGTSPGKFLRSELSWKFLGTLFNNQEISLVFLEEHTELSRTLQRFLD